MEWMTAKEAGALWGITSRRTQILCEKGRVNGAQRLGNMWVIPKGAQKPADGRTKAAKQAERSESNRSEPKRRMKAAAMSRQVSMTPEQSFFAVFCIESLADELNTAGDEIYKLLTEESDILDNYIVRHYDTLHTQGREYIVRDLKELMERKGLLK